jgi:hypothetical protein
MAVNTRISTALASVVNRRVEASTMRRSRRAVDGPPAATHNDRARDFTVATRLDADRLVAETWGWS